MHSQRLQKSLFEHEIIENEQQQKYIIPLLAKNYLNF